MAKSMFDFRRDAVASETTFSEPEKSSAISFPKSSAEMRFLDQCLGRSFIFANLDPRVRHALQKQLQAHTVPRGVEVCKLGAQSDHFWIVKSGQLRMTRTTIPRSPRLADSSRRR